MTQSVSVLRRAWQRGRLARLRLARLRWRSDPIMKQTRRDQQF